MRTFTLDYRRRSRGWFTVLVGLTTMLLTIISPPITSRAQEVKFINIATATMAGTFYPTGAALAELGNNKFPISGHRFSVQATAGGVQNVTFLREKQTVLALLSSPVSYDAWNGEGVFKGKQYRGFRTIVPTMLPIAGYVLTRTDRGIERIEDLKGKKVSVGAAGSGQEQETRVVLGAGYGFNYWDRRDFTPVYIGVAETVDQLKNGFIDAAKVSALVPAASITDMLTSPYVKLLPMTQESIKRITAERPYWFGLPVPKSTYRGQEQDILAAGFSSSLVVREDISAELVHALTKLIFSDIDFLASRYAGWKGLTPKVAMMGAKALGIPLHPGAEKYYRDIGALQ